MAVKSRHPLSVAIAKAYGGETEQYDVSELPGKGLQSLYDGKQLSLGSRRWCGEQTNNVIGAVVIN
jgi:Cu2+-exporting ATPase